MSIKIVDEKPDIYLTQTEHDCLRIEYDKMVMFMVDPPSFEEFVRQRKAVRYSRGGGSVCIWGQS